MGVYMTEKEQAQARSFAQLAAKQHMRPDIKMLAKWALWLDKRLTEITTPPNKAPKRKP